MNNLSKNLTLLILISALFQTITIGRVWYTKELVDNPLILFIIINTSFAAIVNFIFIKRQMSGKLNIPYAPVLMAISMMSWMIPVAIELRLQQLAGVGPFK